MRAMSLGNEPRCVQLTLPGVLHAGDCAISFSLDNLKLARSTSNALRAGMNRSTCASGQVTHLRSFGLYKALYSSSMLLRFTCDFVLQLFAVTLSGVFSCRFFCRGVFTIVPLSWEALDVSSVSLLISAAQSLIYAHTRRRVMLGKGVSWRA